jgi:hypothetical protein
MDALYLIMPDAPKAGQIRLAKRKPENQKLKRQRTIQKPRQLKVPSRLPVLLEALPAVDRPVAARLERDFALLAAIRTNRLMELPFEAATFLF